MKEKANLASFLGIWLDNSTVNAAICKIHLLIQELRVCTSCHDFHCVPERKTRQRNNGQSNATAGALCPTQENVIFSTHTKTKLEYFLR